MQISIVQITNGWIVTVAFPGKGSSSLFCPDFSDAIKQLTDMRDAAMKEHEKETVNHTGVIIPK